VVFVERSDRLSGDRKIAILNALLERRPLRSARTAARSRVRRQSFREQFPLSALPSVKQNACRIYPVSRSWPGAMRLHDDGNGCGCEKDISSMSLLGPYDAEAIAHTESAPWRQPGVRARFLGTGGGERIALMLSAWASQFEVAASWPCTRRHKPTAPWGGGGVRSGRPFGLKILRS
jgi:hypothetical protein